MSMLCSESCNITCNVYIPQHDNDISDISELRQYHRYKWQRPHVNQFLDVLQSEQTAQTLTIGLEALERDEINLGVDTLTNVLQLSAESMRVRFKPMPRTAQTRCRNAEWWDKECEISRRRKGRLLSSFRSSRSPADLAVYLEAKTTYNKLCKAKSRKHKHQLLHSLKQSLRDNNNVWSSIKHMTKSHGPIANDITPSRWYNYFRDLFTSNNDGNEHFNEEVDDFLLIHDDNCVLCENCDDEILDVPISKEEIMAVINDLPNGKSPGADGVLYEMIRNGAVHIIDYIHTLFNKILETSIFPDQWGEAIISPLYKKGSRNEERNYRAISLLCTLGKVFTKVLNNRLTTWAEMYHTLDEGQGAYRKGRGTSENIFNLYAMTEKYLCRKGGRFYCAFVDFSRAFDSIGHTKLWYRLINEGVHGRILVLRSMYRK